mmetsp:Transcript_2146/g.7155  ORF Transcript_2146/g.7155 Transcript_2146/m.7155 type:complete len:228 (-) Transcript_2146:32-715(-)
MCGCFSNFILTWSRYARASSTLSCRYGAGGGAAGLAGGAAPPMPGGAAPPMPGGAAPIGRPPGSGPCCGVTMGSCAIIAPGAQLGALGAPGGAETGAPGPPGAQAAAIGCCAIRGGAEVCMGADVCIGADAIGGASLAATSPGGAVETGGTTGACAAGVGTTPGVVAGGMRPGAADKDAAAGAGGCAATAGSAVVDSADGGGRASALPGSVFTSEGSAGGGAASMGA